MFSSLLLFGKKYSLIYRVNKKHTASCSIVQNIHVGHVPLNAKLCQIEKTY